MVRKLPDVLVRGTVSTEGANKVIKHGSYKAILTRTGKSGNHWVLTGYEVDAQAAGYRQKKGGAG